MERRIFLNMLFGASAAVGLRSFVDLGACVTRFEGSVLDQVDELTRKKIMPGLADMYFKGNPIFHTIYLQNVPVRPGRLCYEVQG